MCKRNKLLDTEGEGRDLIHLCLVCCSYNVYVYDQVLSSLLNFFHCAVNEMGTDFAVCKFNTNVKVAAEVGDVGQSYITWSHPKFV